MLDCRRGKSEELLHRGRPALEDHREAAHRQRPQPGGIVAGAGSSLVQEDMRPGWDKHPAEVGKHPAGEGMHLGEGILLVEEDIHFVEEGILLAEGDMLLVGEGSRL